MASLLAMSVPHHTWYFRVFFFDKVANNFGNTFKAETSE